MTIKLFSALALQKALDHVVLDDFFAQTGIVVDRNFDPTVQLLKRINSGEEFDVMIGVSGSLASLGSVIDVKTITHLAVASLGLANQTGSVRPDISTTEGFVNVLLGARSVAYSRSGASGIYFSELIQRLGIADAIDGRATIVEKGFTAREVVDGRADIAVQQLSELSFIDGIQIVDAFPPELQRYTDFSAAVSLTSSASEESLALIEYLTSVAAQQAYTDTQLTI